MDFTDTLLFSLVAALLSLDQMAAFQIFLSRPILTALILGALFGDLTDAALVGICFEFLFVRSIPMKERAGADPTLATAAVLGGIWGSSAIPGASALHPIASAPFAAGLGLLAAFLSKWFDLRLRGVNTMLAHRLHRIGSIQLTALGALFAKSFGFYLLTVLAMQGALPKIMSALGRFAPTASALAWVALICICVAHASVPLIQGVAAGCLWGLGLALGTVWIVLAKTLGWPPYTVAVCVFSTLAVLACVEAKIWRNTVRGHTATLQHHD